MKTLKELLEGATPNATLRERPAHSCFHPERGNVEVLVCAGDGNCFATFSLGGKGATSCQPDDVRANAQLFARCNPATMRLVLDALTLTEQLLDSPLDYTPRSSAVREAVVSALAALNGASHGEQGEGR